MTRGYVDRLFINILFHRNINSLLLENGSESPEKLLLENGGLTTKDYNIMKGIGDNVKRVSSFSDSDSDSDSSPEMIENQKEDVYKSFELMTMEYNYIFYSDATKIIDDVLRRYNLSDKQIFEDAVAKTIDSTLTGAGETGIKAGLGVVLKTVTRSSGRIAAPFAVASVIIDIGEEYINYRSKVSNKQKHHKITTAEYSLLRQEFFQNMRKQALTSGTAASGAVLACFLLPATTGLAVCTTAALASGFIFYYVGKKIHHFLYKTENEQLQLVINEIEKLEIGSRILFDELDSSHCGYLNKEQTESLITTLYKASNIDLEDNRDILDITVEQLLDDEKQMDWDTFWEWASFNELQKLKAIQNQVKTPKDEKEEKKDENEEKKKEESIKDENKKQIKEIEKLPLEKKRIYALCTLLDIDGIRLFLSDWMLSMPVVNTKEDLIVYCTESIMYNLIIFRAQRISLFESFDDFSCLDIEQLKRMVSDLGFPYCYNNTVEELAKTLKYVLIN